MGNRDRGAVREGRSRRVLGHGLARCAGTHPALKTAYLAALNKQLAREADPMLKAQLKRCVEKTAKELEELKKKSEPTAAVPADKGH